MTGDSCNSRKMPSSPLCRAEAAGPQRRASRPPRSALPLPGFTASVPLGSWLGSGATPRLRRLRHSRKIVNASSASSSRMKRVMGVQKARARWSPKGAIPSAWRPMRTGSGKRSPGTKGLTPLGLHSHFRELRNLDRAAADCLDMAHPSAARRAARHAGGIPQPGGQGGGLNANRGRKRPRLRKYGRGNATGKMQGRRGGVKDGPGGRPSGVGPQPAELDEAFGFVPAVFPGLAQA